MKNKTIKAFAKQYSLHLLPTSNESITLGDLYDKRGRYKFEATNLNVAYKCLDDEKKQDQLKAVLSKTRALKGEFATMQLKGKFTGKTDLSLPFFKLKLGGKIDSSYFKTYEIGNIKKKTLRDKNRRKVMDCLSQYRDKDKAVQKLWIAEGLFYGSDIKITVDKKLSVNAAGKIAKTNKVKDLKIDAVGNHVFTFGGAASYPFAIDLKKVKELL